MIRCSFDIPTNEHVRLTRATFEALYAKIEGPEQEKYRSGFGDLVWQRDANGVEWLNGTLKAWVPGLTQLPIEHVHVWKRWLAADADAEPVESLDEPAISAYTAKETRQSEKALHALAEAMGNVTKIDLARQISDVLVFDYLIVNWDRFSLKPEFYGTNCHFKDGRIVSIDNGAAFQDRLNPVVYENFAYVERFSRQTLRAIRKLDRTRTFSWLFPNPTEIDRARFRIFWAQRQRLLARVDELTAKYGKDAVVVFD
jgi:hypothetical protein